MSWVTIIWSMAASACLTLAAMHLMVWSQNRSKRAHLLFALAAIGIAAVAMIELGLMRAATPEQFAALARWYHVPAWVVILSLVGFVRLYLQAGRPWLAWSVCGVRTLSLLLNFTTGQNLNFREVVSLDHVRLLGESVSVGLGVVNPWVLTGQLSQLLLAVFAADATIVAWRRGDRRQALTVGGTIVVFPLFGTAVAVLLSWGLAPVPVAVSLAFLGVVVAVACELSRDAIRATQLGEELRESEARYRQIFDEAIEGMFRTSVEGKLLLANAAMARILGYDSVEAAMRAIEVTAHQVWADPEERRRHAQALEQEKSIHGYECQFRRKDGTRIWVLLNTRAVQGPDGRVAHFDGFVEDITARRQREEALRSSEACVRSAMDVAGLGFYESDGNGHVTFQDPRFRALLGLPSGEEAHVREWWLAHTHQEDHPRVLQKSRDILEGDVSEVDVHYRYAHPSRGPLWFHHLSRVLERNAAGRPVRLIGVIQDITESRQSEEALRASQLRLASGAELAGLGFYELGEGENVTYLDDRVRAICGIPSDEGRGVSVPKFWLEHLHPDDFPRMLDVHQRLRDGRLDRVSVEYRYLHPDGREVWIHHLAMVPERDGARRRTREIGVMRDVTQEKRATAELVESEERLRQAAEAAGFGVYQFDLLSGQAFYTPEFMALYGLPADAALELDSDMVPKQIHPGDKAAFLDGMREASNPEGEGVLDVEFRIVPSPGAERWLRARGRTVFAGSGTARHPVQASGVILDITARKQAALESQRARSEIAHLSRVSMLGELSGSLAHELNQPLTAILSNAQAAQRFLAEPQPDLQDVRDILQDIVQDDQRAGEVIRRLRLLLKKGALSRTPLDLNEVVRDALRLIGHDLVNHNVKIRTTFAPGLPVVMGDRVQLQQVLLNLIMNATDAMAAVAPADRCVEVLTEPVGPNGVRVSVSDSGAGIAPDIASRLFDAFATTKPFGLGLGLKVCHSIVTAHAGRIEGGNNPGGRGATFSVTLPAVQGDTERGTGEGEKTDATAVV